MNKSFNKILSIILFIILSIPALHHLLGFKTLYPLRGAYVTTELPKLSINSWGEQEFQKQFENFIEDHIGFRPQIIRLINQLNYSFFNELNPKGVLIGKETYLFENSYIETYAGNDFLGFRKIDSIYSKLVVLKNYLQQQNVKLLFVLAPDKVNYYPEYLPNNIKDSFVSDSTNYFGLLKCLERDSIPYINFNPLFLQWKDTAAYSLYPKYGTHWSTYGWTLAVDTLIRKLGTIMNKPMNGFQINSIELTNEPRNTDYDIASFLNIYSKLRDPVYAYPDLVFDTLKSKPNVLVIGDSFYVNIASSDIPDHVFDNHDFLYYNKRVYGNPNKHINLPNDFKNYDLVIVEFASPNIKYLNKNLMQKIGMNQ